MTLLTVAIAGAIPTRLILSSVRRIGYSKWQRGMGPDPGTCLMREEAPEDPGDYRRIHDGPWNKLDDQT